MSPRKYDMGKRAETVARTRRRIIDATRALHGERGIVATSWDDIAARAGVGVGTVYRHFPTLDDLVPACGDVTMEDLALPDPAGAPSLFADAAGPGARIGRLVREAFALYERAAPALRAIRREAGVHPRVAADRDAVEASLGALVDAAVEPLGVAGEDRAVVRALIDLDTWTALRREGIGQDRAVEVVAGMLAGRLTPRAEDTT